MGPVLVCRAVACPRRACPTRQKCIASGGLRAKLRAAGSAATRPGPGPRLAHGGERRTRTPDRILGINQFKSCELRFPRTEAEEDSGNGL